MNDSYIFKLDTTCAKGFKIYKVWERKTDEFGRTANYFAGAVMARSKSKAREEFFSYEDEHCEDEHYED